LEKIEASETGSVARRHRLPRDGVENRQLDPQTKAAHENDTESQGSLRAPTLAWF
jgi:hypothetical protein